MKKGLRHGEDALIYLQDEFSECPDEEGIKTDNRCRLSSRAIIVFGVP